ncbi:MAG: 6-phosphogluconolactonase [Elusimicrobiota bacterium]
MAPAIKPTIFIGRDAAEAVSTAADLWAEAAREAVRERGLFRTVLSGGKTPKALYFLLAAERYQTLPWQATHVFWGDERYIPHEHTESSFRMARDILLSRVPVRPEHVHAIPTESRDPVKDAALYEARLRAHFAQSGAERPVFDLVLLGMGADGHTASLFPESEAARESGKWVAAARADAGVRDRITLTAHVINRSRHALFLVTGEDKAEAVKELLEGEGKAEKTPAKLIRPEEGRLTYLLDAPAASRLRARG